MFRMTRSSGNVSTAKVRAAVVADPRLARHMRKKGKQVERSSKRIVHKKSGKLRRSIHTEIIRSKGLPVARVGSSVSYAHVRHEGSAPHLIHSKPGGYLKFRGRTGFVHTKVVYHRGSRGSHYLTKALRLAAGA